MFRAALIATLILPVAHVAAGDPVLSLPIDCTLGENCYIQNLVDRDPGPEFQDYRCGTLGYSGHKGVDFGLLTLADMHRGVDVLAPAPGVVKAFRDGVADVGPTETTEGQECGNGIVLAHDDGWETQLCHMKSGSILVENGQVVERGEVLGQVGMSGLAQFPHVHISVRHEGKVIDPYDVAEFPTCDQGKGSLWQDTPEYTPGGLLTVGFSSSIPDYDKIKDGSAAQRELAFDAEALVLYGYGFSGKKGDIMQLDIEGPKGPFMSQKVTLDKSQAVFFRATGKRRRAERWPEGDYYGSVTLTRDGQEIAYRRARMTIK